MKASNVRAQAALACWLLGTISIEAIIILGGRQLFLSIDLDSMSSWTLIFFAAAIFGFLALRNRPNG